MACWVCTPAGGRCRLNGIRTPVGVGDCCWHPSNPQWLSEPIVPRNQEVLFLLKFSPKPSQAPMRTFVQRPPCTQAKPHPLPLTGQPQGHACLTPAPSGVADTTSLLACSLALHVAHVEFFGFLLGCSNVFPPRPSLRGPPELRSLCRSHLLPFADLSQHGCVSVHGTHLLQSARFSRAALYSPAALHSLQSPAPLCYHTVGPLHVSPSCTLSPAPALRPAPDLLSLSLFICLWFPFKKYTTNE